MTADGSMALPALLQYLVQLCKAERGYGTLLCSIVCSRIWSNLGQVESNKALQDLISGS